MKLYLVRNKGDNFPYGRYEKPDERGHMRDPYYAIASQIRNAEGHLVSESRQSLMSTAEKAELITVDLMDLSEEEIEILRKDPDILSVEPAKDGVFKDYNHEEEIIISEDGTRWESGDPF